MPTMASQPICRRGDWLEFATLHIAEPYQVHCSYYAFTLLFDLYNTSDLDAYTYAILHSLQSRMSPSSEQAQDVHAPAWDVVS